MGNTYMPKPENRYPNNVSGFEHIWELDMLIRMDPLHLMNLVLYLVRDGLVF